MRPLQSLVLPHYNSMHQQLDRLLVQEILKNVQTVILVVNLLPIKGIEDGKMFHSNAHN